MSFYKRNSRTVDENNFALPILTDKEFEIYSAAYKRSAPHKPNSLSFIFNAAVLDLKQGIILPNTMPADVVIKRVKAGRASRLRSLNDGLKKYITPQERAALDAEASTIKIDGINGVSSIEKLPDKTNLSRSAPTDFTQWWKRH